MLDAGYGRCVILGAGGHAKVLLDSLSWRRDLAVVAALDPDPCQQGKDILGVPIVGGDELLDESVSRGWTHFAVGVGSVGDNSLRRGLYEKALRSGLEPAQIVHQNSIVSRFAELGPGCQVLPGAIINAGASVGINVIVNSGAVVEHDCLVGDHAHIASGARLASGVVVEPLAFVGAGATIRQCITIGEAAVVGAGAVVVKEVRAGAVVVGSPARERVDCYG